MFQALEMFSTLMKDISTKLDDFMHEIVDCDMGNDPTQTKELLDCQETRSVAVLLVLRLTTCSVSPLSCFNLICYVGVPLRTQMAPFKVALWVLHLSRYKLLPLLPLVSFITINEKIWVSVLSLTSISIVCAIVTLKLMDQFRYCFLPERDFLCGSSKLHNMSHKIQ